MPAVFADVLPRGAEKDAPHFVSKLDKRGIGVMELLAMDIKSRGMFLARSLSYERAEFKIDKAKQMLSDIEDLYNEKEEIFNNAESELARFRDRNLNLGSAVARTEQERLLTQLRDMLEQSSRTAQLERKAGEARSTQEIVNGIPLTIYVG